MRDDPSSGDGYYYSREERLRRGGKEPGPTGKGGIFRNRTLLIIFLDVVLIFIIFGAANVLFPIFGSRSTIEGNLFRLRGVEVEDTVLMTLVVLRQSPDPPGESGVFQVRFALEDGTGRVEEVSEWISDAAPTVPEERRVVRFEAPVETDVRRWETAVATIRYEDREVRLASRIIGEP
ncbi:MAG: hypothetical protein ACLFPV_07610 [Spirochaetaceae bacterium]